MQKNGEKMASEEVGRRKWQWLGHPLRKPPGNIIRQALTWNPEGHSLEVHRRGNEEVDSDRMLIK